MREELFYPRRNFAAIPDKEAALETARVVILPVPYDGTTDWKSGTREGPMAIIDASQQLEFYDIELGRELRHIGIHTLPELEPSKSGPGQTAERVLEVVGELIGAGKFVVMLGGEHTLTLGAVKAYLRKYPDMSVLQLDAHADLRDEYEGTKYSHACVMRRVQEHCPIIQVGVRTLALEEHQFLAKSRLKPFFAQGQPWDSDFLDRVVAALSENVYVTIDLDVFDSALMPAVSNPQPGGPGWYEVLSLLSRVSARRNIVGFDVVELCPQDGLYACAFLAAKLTYKLIGLATTPRDLL